MSILFLGDSITQGVGASDYKHCYVELVSKNLNINTINYGVSATRIARQNLISSSVFCSNFDFNLRFEIMEKNADAVVVFGGTNDFGHGIAPIGNVGDTSVYTFYGAVNHLLKNLVKQYGKEKLVLILPLPRKNQDNEFGDFEGVKHGVRANLSVYKQILKYYALQYDIYFVDYENYFSKNHSIIESLFADGLHPNNKGHQLLAELISKDLEKILNK